jgi:hypothetical protein
VAERRFALAVARDPIIIADRSDKPADLGPKALPEIRLADVGLLDQVVQGAGGDQVVGRPGPVQQRGDLERVQDERRAVAPLLYWPACIRSASSTAARVCGSPATNIGIRRCPGTPRI